MTIATDDGIRLNAARPWAALARELEDAEGHWSDYAAWKLWLDRRLDAMATTLDRGNGVTVPGFQPGPLLDMLDDLDTEIGLYVVMCDLADGAPAGAGGGGR